MVPQVLTADLIAAAERLAGGKPRGARHGLLFRMSVTAKDGVRATVTFQIDGHRKWAMPYVLNDLARILRIERDDVLTVFGEWTHEQLVVHLEQFTSEELRPPAYRRK